LYSLAYLQLFTYSVLRLNVVSIPNGCRNQRLRYLRLQFVPFLPTNEVQSAFLGKLP